jgi:phage terminase large subunit GpA-like protein
MYTDIVYRFCDRWQATFASKGLQNILKRKEEGVDPMAPSNFKRYRAARSEKSAGTIFYEIATNYYKRLVYNNLKIKRREIGEQPPGFCDFPVDYGENYFKMLTAEEQRVDGSFHAHRRRNEALDCRVGNLCAADVHLDAKVSEARAAAKAKGVKEIDLQKINHRFVLEMMIKQTAPQRGAP